MALLINTSRDPIPTLQKAYTHFGLPLTKTAEEYMKNFLPTHSKHKHEEHRYSLSEFGLSDKEVFSHFKTYIHRHELNAS